MAKQQLGENGSVDGRGPGYEQALLSKKARHQGAVKCKVHINSHLLDRTVFEQVLCVVELWRSWLFRLHWSSCLWFHEWVYEHSARSACRSAVERSCCCAEIMAHCQGFHLKQSLFVSIQNMSQDIDIETAKCGKRWFHDTKPTEGINSYKKFDTIAFERLSWIMSVCNLDLTSLTKSDKNMNETFGPCLWNEWEHDKQWNKRTLNISGVEDDFAHLR